MRRGTAAFVLTIAALAGGASAQWTLVEEFTSPGSGDSASFGGSMALRGETLMVAGYGAGVPAGVYPFTRVGGVWTAESMVPADGDAGPIIPGRVAMEGDSLFVSDNSFSEPREFAGIVYRYVLSGGEWVFAQRIVPASGARYDQFFGSSMDADGDRLLVGAFGDRKHAPRQGAAFVYENVGGTYQQTARLEASDGSEGDWFGRGCAIDGDTAVVFASRDVESGVFSGSLYVFEHDGQSWQQTAKIVQPVRGEYEHEDFGFAIALEDDTLVVGAPDAEERVGRVYVYGRVGEDWQLVQTIESVVPAQEAAFGRALALAGGSLVVGAPNESLDGGDADEGAVHVFTRESGVWVPAERLIAGTPTSHDDFGTSVVIDGATIAAATDCPRPDVVSVFEADADCVADWNTDGYVDSRDVLAYLNAWNADEQSADLTGDGEVDTRDLLQFLNLWAAGC